jgi:hypothetical protein
VDEKAGRSWGEGVFDLAREDDDLATGKGTPDRIPGPPSDEEMMAHGEGAKPLQVGGEAPGELTLIADSIASIEGDNQGDAHRRLQQRPSQVVSVDL